MSYTEEFRPVDARFVNERLAPLERALTDLRKDVTAMQDTTKALIRLANEQTEAAKPKWQPIETAPMPEVGAPGYGTRVLLAVDCGDGTIKSVRVGWWDGSGWDVQNLGYRVTHWMPLPAAPEGE